VKQGGLAIGVVFVTDGGKEMGIGYVMRALKIAKDKLINYRLEKSDLRFASE